MMGVIGFIGAGAGCFVYDVAKLIRREARRRRKLSQELGNQNG